MIIKVSRWLTSLLFIVIVAGLGITGCATLQSENTTSQNPSTTIEQASKEENLPRLEGNATVVMVVNEGQITIELNGNDAPITAGNFVELVNQGFYDGLSFHRVIREPQPFVVQGGDPNGNGTGGSGRNIPLEIKLEGDEEPTYDTVLGRQGIQTSSSVVLPHTRGAIAMARSQPPNSASSQFYFALADLEFLNGDYAVFGYVTEGMEIVDQIQQGDQIATVTVTEGLENLK